MKKITALALVMILLAGLAAGGWYCAVKLPLKTPVGALLSAARAVSKQEDSTVTVQYTPLFKTYTTTIERRQQCGKTAADDALELHREEETLLLHRRTDVTLKDGAYTRTETVGKKTETTTISYPACMETQMQALAAASDWDAFTEILLETVRLFPMNEKRAAEYYDSFAAALEKEKQVTLPDTAGMQKLLRSLYRSLRDPDVSALIFLNWTQTETENGAVWTTTLDVPALFNVLQKTLTDMDEMQTAERFLSAYGKSFDRCRSMAITSLEVLRFTDGRVPLTLTVTDGCLTRIQVGERLDITITINQ